MVRYYCPHGSRVATLRGADLTEADLTKASLRYADLRGATLTGAILTGADLTGAKRGALPANSTMPEPQPSQSSSTPDWLSLVETVGSNLFITAATLASIIQGLDVIERRWREHKEKQQQHSAHTPQPSSASSTQQVSTPSRKIRAPDSEIIEILLVMDDGSHHSFKRWVSDPDTLRAYIDAFSDPTSKVKPLQVVFMKRKGRALVVNVTTGGKDNPQLNVILGYLEADPQ